MKRLLVMGALLLAAIAVSPSIGFAGGFVVTTLDPLPDRFEAGQTYAIGFMLRQHGVTPVRDGRPNLILQRGDQSYRLPARAEGALGHYVVDVVFAQPGTWTLAMDQAPFPQTQPLGTVQVVEGPVPNAPDRRPAELALASLLLLGFGGVGMVWIVVRKHHPRRRTALATQR
jgi:hypothetical protein